MNFVLVLQRALTKLSAGGLAAGIAFVSRHSDEAVNILNLGYGAAVSSQGVVFFPQNNTNTLEVAPLSELARRQLFKCECQHNSRANLKGCPVCICALLGSVRINFWQATLPWNSDIRLDEMATNNSQKDGLNTNRDLAYSSKRETIVFEIQTRG